MIAWLLGLPVASAAVNDIYPTDYAALPEGTTVATLYYYHRQYDNYFRNGQSSVTGSIRSDIAALRLARYFRHGGVKWAPVVVASYAANAVSGDAARAAFGTKAEGLGDIRFGAAAWFVDNPAQRHFLAASLIFLAPTGQYSSSQILNAGENRWRQVLSLGWIKGLGDKWTVDLTPELAWYGDNDNYNGGKRLEQAPSIALTGYLRHHFSRTWQGFAGAQLNDGGETTVNGVAQKNEPHTQRVLLGAIYIPDADTQFIVRYGRDVSLDNGFRNSDEFSLRFLKRF